MVGTAQRSAGQMPITCEVNGIYVELFYTVVRLIALFRDASKS
jgi:hypothetical protein